MNEYRKVEKVKLSLSHMLYIKLKSNIAFVKQLVAWIVSWWYQPCHSCWLATTVASVQSHVRTCWICGGQSDTGAGFLQVTWFPLSILIASMLHTRLSFVAGTVGTWSHPTPQNKKIVDPIRTSTTFIWNIFRTINLNKIQGRISVTEMWLVL
jgi:hypothetical protein